MALRRPHRAIETFDIALMAVVTKAMGAFLVLMLLMIPHYNALPEAEQQAEQAEGKRKQAEQKVSTLKRQKETLLQRGHVEPAEQARLTQRLAQLERQNAGLRAQAAQPTEAIATLILTFNHTLCDSRADIDFFAEAETFTGDDIYAPGEKLKLADGSDWPDVRPERQPVPLGVVEYRNSTALPAELTNLYGGLMGYVNNEPDRRPFDSSMHNLAERQKMWAINNVRPGTRFAIYIKIRVSSSFCSPRVGTLAIGHATTAPKGNPPPSRLWNQWAFESSGRRVWLLGYVTWTSSGLTVRDPVRAEQVGLDRRMGVRK